MLVNVDKNTIKKKSAGVRPSVSPYKVMEHIVEVKDNVKATVEGAGSTGKRDRQ